MNWTDAQKLKIAAEYGKRSAALVAKDYGCSRNAIIGLWFRLGLSKDEGVKPVESLRPAPKPRMPKGPVGRQPKHDPEIIRMTNWGWPVTDIAAALGMTIPGIYCAQHRLGLREARAA